MRSEELAPRGTGTPRGRRDPRPSHDRADRRSADPDPELAELSLDPDASPPGVLPPEANDQILDLWVERRATEPPSPAKRPLPPHELAVPPKQGLRRHEKAGPSVPGKHPAARRDENAVHASEPRSPGLPPEHGELVSEHGVLDLERGDGRPSRESAEESAGDPVDHVEEHRRMIRIGRRLANPTFRALQVIEGRQLEAVKALLPPGRDDEARRRSRERSVERSRERSPERSSSRGSQPRESAGGRA